MVIKVFIFDTLFQKMRSEVRSTIGSFISRNKVDQIRSEEDKRASSFAESDPVASSILKKVLTMSCSDKH